MRTAMLNHDNTGFRHFIRASGLPFRALAEFRRIDLGVCRTPGRLVEEAAS